MKILYPIILLFFLTACGPEASTEPDPPSPPPPSETDPRWSSAAPLPITLQEFHAAVLDGKIYIAGGIGNGNADSDRAYRYDPEENNWERISDLPGARHHMPLAVANDTLYAIGGLISGPSSFESTSNLWLYNTGTNQWETRAPLPQPRGASAAGVVGDKIIVVGGYGSGSQLISDIAIYDPTTDSWSTGAPIPTTRDHLTAATVDGILYAIGGRKVLMEELVNAVEGYDIETDEWSSYHPMITQRAGLGGTELDGIIYTYGGELSGPAQRHHEAFDPSENSWHTLPTMPNGRHGMGVAAVNGKIYIIGGGPQTGFSQSTTVQVFTP
jgi:N-acetylneuraminic acid mutarotase